MNPENLLFSAALERARSSLTRTSAVHTEKSCPCACQMESGAEQEAHCNSEMKGKKHFSIEDTSSECFGISAVKVLCKSCRTLTEIVGREDAGAVKTIGTFEGTPLKCSSKKIGYRATNGSMSCGRNARRTKARPSIRTLINFKVVRSILCERNTVETIANM